MLQSVFKQLKPMSRTELPIISEGVDAYFLSKNFEKNQKYLILTENAKQALRLKDELQFYLPQYQISYFPDWEILPYDQFSPQQDLISERLAVLWQTKQQQIDVLIVPITTAMQKVAPVEFVLSRTFWLKCAQKLNIDRLRQDLVFAGYQHVTQVVAAGEFSIRGSLIDLFPTGSAIPYRLDLFDEEIESIKAFDVDTQRTLYPVSEIKLMPAHEFPTDEEAQTVFRQKFREYIESDPTKAKVYQDVSNGLFGAGVEYYLPFFFEQMATIFDYIDPQTIIIEHNKIAHAAQTFILDVRSRYQMATGNPLYPPVKPELLYLNDQDLFITLKNYCRVVLPIGSLPENQLPDLAVERRVDNPLVKLAQFCATFTGKILLTADSLGRRETMAQFLTEHQLKPKLVESWQAFLEDKKSLLSLVVAPLEKGFLLPEEHTAFISEADLYQHVVRLRKARKKHSGQSDSLLRDLAEIKIGDPVVHEEHGIGRYQGLETMDLGEGNTELMRLEYADDAVLYVPVSQLHLISRYAGQAHDDIHLHRLGSPAWEKVKKKAAQKAHDTAAELLNLYAQRAAQKGFQYSLNEVDYHTFAAGFEYEETPDQANAITAVIEDLCSEKPMDRLVCGDVGFGKTEVALRAAFVAVMAGKQVAILAPTTLLVEQHFQTFSDRFADFPVKIAELSRFNSGKQTKAALAGLVDGTVDIVVGTHKLVQPDIVFQNLGLVIIDEEHRFGVRQKEQLKQLRANVDVLTLTATPIPRTLSMALEGLRDFSIIATAPNRRLSVKTFVTPYNRGSIREAILRELKRGGQVFFLHNEVDTIENMKERLQELMPEARIGVAHGQLKSRELEAIMRDFMQQRFNVLLCSTIIETGIDIPNANTIIINRADKFGLAQLHQLRGRVGRSHHQAYAYLLTPDGITKDAQKRLEAIQMAEELGAGFYLAMQDLEIRGAGEVLGEGQSGEMIQVGFSLYTEMLKQAVRDLKNGRIPDTNAPLGVNTEIKLHSPALLPEEYCPDIHERLVLYKRLAACENNQELGQIYEELVDRFGLPPQPVKTLIESHKMRLQAKALGIEQIDASAGSISLTFGKQHEIDPVQIIQLIQNNKNYRLVGGEKLRVTIDAEDIEARINQVYQVIKELSYKK
ncbi:transcription-repair coupling factor [Neisseria sp. Ec49-e6-T10]|uniref:transcription-repair coupling factor n=1 Tax=Neisseria sp. Ec49-e6-T10 TaxID=3140744 RepID=UPI003EB8F3AB